MAQPRPARPPTAGDAVPGRTPSAERSFRRSPQAESPERASQAPGAGGGGAARSAAPASARAQRAAAKGVRLARTTAQVGRAASGDALAATKLVMRGARKVVRSRTFRFISSTAVFLAFVMFMSMCDATAEAEATSAGRAPPAVMDQMWAAYRHAAGLRCTPDGQVTIDPRSPELLTAADMTVVVSVGRTESAHGRAVRRNPNFGWISPGIDAFGDFVVPVLSVPLYDPADFHAHIEDDPKVSTVLDHDGGRWDANPWVDHAIGPTQTLPSFVAAHGVDGNGDGIISPHNAFDAVATTTAFFCKQTAAGRTLDEALLAYTNDQEYVDVVADRYGWTRQRWSTLTPFELPAGAPLVFDPAAAARWEPHLGAAAHTDPLLVALVDAVGDATADRGGIDIDPAAVACGAGGICVWRDPTGSRSTVDTWDGLAELSLGAPRLLWDRKALTVSGALPPTGFTIAWPVASTAGNPDTKLAAPQFPPDSDRVSFPVSITPWPATPLRAPAWLDWHVPAGSPAWETYSGDGALHLAGIPAGAEVFAPTAGTRTPNGTCAQVTDPAGWIWDLCGVSLTAANRADGPTFSGMRLGHATGGQLTVRLWDPTRLAACPQALLRRWSHAATSPTSDWPYRSGEHITSEIFALWAQADALWEASLDPDLTDHEIDSLRARAAALEAKAEALVVDLFEVCQESGYRSSFRDRRPARSAGVEQIAGGWA